MDLYNVRKQLNMGFPLTSIKLRVTDYSRVSTDHIEQQKSLKNQIDHFDEMIKNNKNWTYVKGYVDEGITGTSDIKRDSFMKMIDDARNNKFDLIITKEISRFSRNTLDSIKYTRELLSYGVAVLFVNDNINTALPDSELRLTIMASMAQDEIRRLSQRVKFGMNRSIKNGTILGNNLLYGYKKDKLTGNLIIIREEAKVVEEIYKLYVINEYSLNKIAQILNKEGIKTCQNKSWCTSTISRMIKNYKYKGYYCGKKTEIIDYMTKKVKYLPKKDWIIYEDNIKIPPIIEEELWNKANKRLKERSKKFGNQYKENKLIYTNRYPLSAKIYCLNDKEVFHRRIQCKDAYDITWVCSKYLKEGKKVCNSANIRQSEIYQIFDDIITKLKINIINIPNILIRMYKNNKNNIDINIKEKELHKEKEKIISKKEKILELNLEGNLSNREFNGLNNKYNKIVQDIDEEIKMLKKDITKFVRNEEKLKEQLSKNSKINRIRDKLIKLLLDKIIVSTINNDKYNIKLKIFLNFTKEYVEKELKRLVILNDGQYMFFSNEYEFKRGYNTTSTKRYIVKYHIESYISNGE